MTNWRGNEPDDVAVDIRLCLKARFVEEYVALRDELAHMPLWRRLLAWRKGWRLLWMRFQEGAILLDIVAVKSRPIQMLRKTRTSLTPWS